MVIKARLSEALAHSKKSQADISRATGVTTAGVNLWFKEDGKKTVTLKHDNLLLVAECLEVSVEWLTGKSTVRHPVSNMSLVSDYVDGAHTQIAQYDTETSAGFGNEVSEPLKPSDYVTFKTSWLKKKGYIAENMCVIYVRGDSMENRIQDGDVVLIRRDRRKLIDGRIYALNYSGLARLKRVVSRANGNILLVSDNDPDGTRREEITPDTFDQLNLIGEAVWVGGDLK